MARLIAERSSLHRVGVDADEDADIPPSRLRDKVDLN